MSKPKVHANSRSVVYAGDGLKHVCAPPDVCKTPTPGGPQPVPYVNVGMSSDLSQGSKRVKIASKSIAIAGSSLKQTTGDEPGSAGGLVSGKTKGKAGWIAGMAGSANVLVEGKAIIRFLDPIMHNGNTWNTGFQSPGYTGFAYADDFDGLCPICSEGPEQHRVLEQDDTVLAANELISGLRTARTTKGCKPVTRRGSGYMVAVMRCRCNQIWVAMSGPRTHPGFIDVAAGVATSRKHVADGGVVDADQLWATNRSSFSTSGQAGFLAAWEAADERYRSREVGFNLPGKCAAAKVLSHAAGHLPVAMTERYFAPKKSWSAAYRVRQTNLSPEQLSALSAPNRMRVFRNVLADPNELMTFDSSPDEVQTVASCHTCQATLYMVMCEAPPCG